MRKQITFVVRSKQFTAEKVNRNINKALCKLFPLHKRSVKIVKAYVGDLCGQLTGQYIDLVQYHISLTEMKEVKPVHIKALSKKYDQVVSGLVKLLHSLKESKRMCFLVTWVWLQVIKEQEKEAGKMKDEVARSLAIQLHDDMVQTVLKLVKPIENEYPLKDDFIFTQVSDGDWYYNIPVRQESPLFLRG